MSRLLEEINARWEAMFTALARGEDLPPGPRLRTEGLMEAAVLLGLAREDALQQAMGEAYQRSFGRSLGQDFGAGWEDFFPFPQIPAMAGRAPVVPSTRD